MLRRAVIVIDRRLIDRKKLLSRFINDFLVICGQLAANFD